MHKDIHESSHMVRWGLLVGLIACVALIVLITTMNFAFLRNPAVTQDWVLRFFFIILAILFTAFICRHFIYFLADRLNTSYLKRFTEIKSLGTYKETHPKLYNPGPKLHHVVLLLHGFTDSSQQFDLLSQKLTEARIPFYAPNILGFGLNSTALLENVRNEDWFREALAHYDNLKLLAENVSVVGHSMGGMLAAFVAEQRKVQHLILSAPAFFSTPGDLKYKKVLLSPYSSRFYSWLVPYLPKSVRPNRKTTCDTLDHTAKVFQYMSVPTNCIKELFKAQDALDITQAKFETLTVFHGKHDITIDNKKFISYLHRKNIKFTEHFFTNSAHNIFEDYERDKACEIVVDIVRSKSE